MKRLGKISIVISVLIGAVVAGRLIWFANGPELGAAAAGSEVARWLLPMAFLNLRTWREHSAPDPRHRDVWTQHGVPPADVTHAALVDALRTLIVPGLEELRIPTDALRAWLDDGAPTNSSRA